MNKNELNLVPELMKEYLGEDIMELELYEVAEEARFMVQDVMENRLGYRTFTKEESKKVSAELIAFANKYDTTLRA